MNKRKKNNQIKFKKDYSISEIVAEQSEEDEEDKEDLKEIYRMSKSINFEDLLINNQKILQNFNLNKEFKRKIIKIQSFLKMVKFRRNYIQKKKRLKYRENIIKEIISTEKIYVANLDLINQEILIPVLNHDILEIQDFTTLFSNIESILNLNKTFLEILIINTKKKNLPLIKEIKNLIPFFKLYFSYYNNFEESRKLLIRFKKEKHKFYQFLQPLEFTPTLKNMDLSSFLVMPVQRLPKYVLLFKDLLKNTDENHPDYENIEEVLNKFIELNYDNNQKMDKYIKNLKMFEIQKNFHSEKFNILNAQREFISEEVLNMICNNSSNVKYVICYFFTDLFLIAERDFSGQNFHLIQEITLNSFSKFKDQPNTKVIL